MKKFLNKIKIKIKESFAKSWAGKEDYQIITHWWGILAYIITFFVLNPIINANPFGIIDLIIAAIIIIYFILHIIFLRKNKASKPKLSKEEKEKLAKIAEMSKSKRFARKLFLQESITKWRPGMVYGAIDLLIILEFYKYLY
jgi:predicted membrane protein